MGREQIVTVIDTDTRDDVELAISMLRFLDANGSSFTVPDFLLMMILCWEYGPAGPPPTVHACRGGCRPGHGVPNRVVERHEARAKRAICAGVILGRIGVTTLGRVGLREHGGELPH